MPRATFTVQWVKAVKSPENGQIDYFDMKSPNVGLRISPSGRKTWFVMYRSGGRLRRLTLGTYPALSLADARERAIAAKHRVAKGEDPASQKQNARNAPTVADLAKEYVERYAKPRKKSWRDDARLLHREVLPAWGGRKAHEITRKDVRDLLNEIVGRGAPIQANRVLALIRVMFNWAIDQDELEHNPCFHVKAPSKEHQRDRVLTEDEIRRVWGAFKHLDPVLTAYCQVRLLTAQRGGEIRLMHWENIDEENGWWTIPAHVAKNGLAHRVPLSPVVQQILQSLRTTTGSVAWVFPSPRLPEKPIVNVERPVRRVRALSGVDFIPHDLRRTAASLMTSMGISRLVVSKILNHAEGGITSIYDRHSYDPEKRAALEAWSQKVMELIGGRLENS